jgi:hypothetical protein
MLLKSDIIKQQTFGNGNGTACSFALFRAS